MNKQKCKLCDKMFKVGQELKTIVTGFNNGTMIVAFLHAECPVA